MINQNNSKTHISVNISQTNKRVQQFAYFDLKRMRRKANNLNLKNLNATYFSKTTISQESSFREEFYDENKNINQIIEETYQLKRREFDQNSSQNSSNILPSVQNQDKSEKSFQEKDKSKLKKQTSINKIHLTQNDDSILSDLNHQQKTLSFVQRNKTKIYQKINDQLKTSPKVNFKSKFLQTQFQNSKQDQANRFPQIWSQQSNTLIQNEKSKTKACFLKLEEQFKKMENDKVFEPFLKDQKQKVKLMTPLVIRKDKPYYVAENKDNKNLIDNMKNENTNFSKDEYLMVSYDKILEYI
ncbi:unnamed protein product [Paramecium sonneborni]|uniref:Uncharacterized protein n=1 Tax=Paramecium sonneborni TaxID=65129 RepID=A0A8S1P7U5_9CILI|nr:unnamed protein product [Paramecium sonneborni]